MGWTALVLTFVYLHHPLIFVYLMAVYSLMLCIITFQVEKYLLKSCQVGYSTLPRRLGRAQFFQSAKANCVPYYESWSLIHKSNLRTRFKPWISGAQNHNIHLDRGNMNPFSVEFEKSIHGRVSNQLFVLKLVGNVVSFPFSFRIRDGYFISPPWSPLAYFVYVCHIYALLMVLAVWFFNANKIDFSSWKNTWNHWRFLSCKNRSLNNSSVRNVPDVSFKSFFFPFWILRSGLSSHFLDQWTVPTCSRRKVSFMAICDDQCVCGANVASGGDCRCWRNHG
jgi:hypothetical protein